MEELKILVSMVAGLPQMALWVVVLFFIYKISIIGSIYGLVRYITSKLHDWAITKKAEPTELIKEKSKIKELSIVNDGTYEELLQVLKNTRQRGNSYINSNDLEWIKSAFEEKKASDLLKTHKTP